MSGPSGERDVAGEAQELARLRAERDAYKRALEQAPIVVAILQGPDMVFTFANSLRGRPQV